MSKKIQVNIGITEDGQLEITKSSDFPVEFIGNHPASVLYHFILWAMNDDNCANLFKARVDMLTAQETYVIEKDKYEQQVYEYIDKMQRGEIQWSGADLAFFDTDDDDGPVYH